LISMAAVSGGNQVGIYDGKLTLASTGAATFSSTVTATSFNGSATLTGTPTAPTATVGTNTTQIATTAFVNSSLRPYKSYAALLTQIGTSAPVAIVLENTLGGMVVFTRSGVGIYIGTLTGAFVANKTLTLGVASTHPSFLAINRVTNDTFAIVTENSGGTLTDSLLNVTSIEIRVYN